MLDRHASREAGSDRLVVSVVGELDMARECELLNLLIALDLRPPVIVDVDLSEVTFVDASGLRSIVKAQAYLEGIGCELRLVDPRTQFLKVIDLVGLGGLLTVVDRSPRCSRATPRAAESWWDASPTSAPIPRRGLTTRSYRFRQAPSRGRAANPPGCRAVQEDPENPVP
jgi:anti-sigma B factor antagonist